jgi:hypothetical protein
MLVCDKRSRPAVILVCSNFCGVIYVWGVCSCEGETPTPSPYAITPSLASDLRRVFLAGALFRGIIDLASRDYAVVRIAFTSVYMSVVRLLPYYFGTVYRPTLNLQVLLNGLSRKLQPVPKYSGYLNYQARVSRKGLLNQHSQRPTLFWLQMESLKTCTHDICWSDLF